MDVEALLVPVAPGDTAGPDLSYDPGRQAIEAMFDSADEADWSRAIAMIEAQARVTRDAWLGVYLARAGARSGDLASVEAGVALLAGLFENCWDALHPSLDEYGIEGRKGACESLVRIGEFLAPLRQIPLLVHARLGSFSGADFERFARGHASEKGYGQFRAALADTPADVLPDVLQRMRRIRAAIERADIVLSTRAEALGHTGTNFRPTYDALDSLIASVAAYGENPPSTPASADGPDRAGVADSNIVATQSVEDGVGRIRGRDDVARAIDAIVDYYRRSEPSSPVPVALTRIKGWITMDFVAILDDIAPGSVTEAANVLCARPVQERGSSDQM